VHLQLEVASPLTLTSVVTFQHLLIRTSQTITSRGSRVAFNDVEFNPSGASVYDILLTSVGAVVTQLGVAFSGCIVTPLNGGNPMGAFLGVSKDGFSNGAYDVSITNSFFGGFTLATPRTFASVISVGTGNCFSGCSSPVAISIKGTTFLGVSPVASSVYGLQVLNSKAVSVTMTGVAMTNLTSGIDFDSSNVSLTLNAALFQNNSVGINSHASFADAKPSIFLSNVGFFNNNFAIASNSSFDMNVTSRFVGSACSLLRFFSYLASSMQQSMLTLLLCVTQVPSGKTCVC